MKSLLFIFLLTSQVLLADTKYELLQLYKNQDYNRACQLGYDTFTQHKRDEEFISLFAFSCLYADYIDRLSAPAALLKLTPESRANAAYFAIIVMQKKLLYHALLDNYQLSKFVLPSTDYVLSKVFDAYAQLPKNTQKEKYIFQDKKNPKLHYELYIQKGYKIDKMIIDEVYDTILIKHHEYW